MNGTDHDEVTTRKDVLEELFSHAALRERPPAAAERASREALRAQWRQLTRRSRRRRRAIALAAAASIVVAVAVTGLLLQSPAGPVAGLDTASVERVRGKAYRHGMEGATAVELQPGDRLLTRQTVSTAYDGGLALRWHNGITLRLDQNSRVTFSSTHDLELTAGRIYVDTDDGAGDDAALVLSTPAGPVRHVGTRYMVAVGLRSTSVSVREGQVLFGSEDAIASAGERLVMNAAGEGRRERISVYGDDWQWTEALAEPVSLGGRSAAVLLEWIGHETGRRVEYASPDVSRLAGETLLHGDVGLEPMRALDLVERTTDLTAEIRNGTLWVDSVATP